MKKVVFICRGNMFRSQVAEALFNRLAVEKGIISESFGTQVRAEGREGVPLSTYPEIAPMLAEMKKDGFDLYNKTPHQIEESSLEGVSKIIMMSEPEYTPDWVNKYPYEYWQIENPISADNELSRRIIEEIKAKVVALIEEI